jgi:hypothetical protein
MSTMCVTCIHILCMPNPRINCRGLEIRMILVIGQLYDVEYAFSVALNSDRAQPSVAML